MHFSLRVILFFTIVLFIKQNALFSQSTQTRSALSITNEGAAGIDWDAGSLSNAGSQSDANAFQESATKNKVSAYLNFKNFNFDIPAGSTINGVLIEIDKNNSGSTKQCYDMVVQLFNAAGTRANDNKADLVTNWPAADIDNYTQYGNGTDKWGFGVALTEALVEDADFGVSIQVNPEGVSGTYNYYIDHVQITVSYTPIGNANIITPASGTFTASDNCNWISLGSINVQEGDNSDFDGDGDYILELPAGYIFDETVGSVAYTASRDLDAAAVSYASGDLVITLSTDASTDSQDDFTISGLKIKSSTSVNGSHNLAYNAVDSDDLWGAVAGENHANFTCNNIPITTASVTNFTLSDATYVTVNNIVIDETIATNFRPSQTNKFLEFAPPTGFTFDTGTLPTVTASSGTSVTINARSFVGGSLMIDITTDAATNQTDEITISGLKAEGSGAAAGDYYASCTCDPTDGSNPTGNWGIGSSDNASGILRIIAPIVSSQDGDWDDGTTWVGGLSPTVGQVAKVLAAHTVNVDNSATCAGLFVEGILLWTANTKTITVTGDAEISGTIDQSSQNGSVLQINGNCLIDGGTVLFQAVGNGGDFFVDGNLSMSGNNALALTAKNNNQDITVGGNLHIIDGISQIGGSNFVITGTTQIDGELEFYIDEAGEKIFYDDITISASGIWDNIAGEVININNDIANNGSWIGCSGGTCTMNIGNETIGAYQITGNPVQSSIFDIAASTTLNNLGEIHIDGTTAGVLTGTGIFTNGTNSILLIGGTGDCIDVTTFNASASGNNVNYSATDNQNIRVPSDGSYYDLGISNGFTKSLTNNTTVDNKITIEDATIVDASTYTFNGDGDTELAMTDDCELRLEKLGTVPEFLGTYTLLGGTITLNGGGVQTYNSSPSGASSCYSLKLDGSGAKIIDGGGGGTLSIADNLTVSGTSTIGSHTAISQVCTGTFIYESSATTTLSNFDISIGNFSQTNTGTLDDNTRNITVCGSSFDRAAGTFSASGTATFNGSTTVSGAAFTTFSNVTINNTKTLTSHATDMGVTGTWNLINGGTFDANNGEVTFSGSSTIAGTGISTFYDIEINSAGTVTGHGTNVNISHDWLYTAGTYNTNTGKVTFTGTEATQTITYFGGGTFSFYDLYVDKTVGTLTVAATTDIEITSLLTINDGIFDLNTQTLTGIGGLTMPVATDGDLKMAVATSTPALTGTYTLLGGVITLDGGAQILRPGESYYDLVLTSTTGGAKTLTGVITVNGDITVSGDATIGVIANLAQNSGKTFYYNSTGTTGLNDVSGGGSITIGNYSQSNGTLGIHDNNTLVVSGSSWNLSGGTFSTEGTVEFNSTGAQTLTGATAFDNLTMDNTNGLTLNNSFSIGASGTLLFTNGIISTGSNSVIITDGGSVTPTNGWVFGYLQKAMTAVLPARTFELGSGTSYTPVELTFSGVSVDGDIVVKGYDGEHPDIFAANIDPTKSVNKYWAIANSGVTFVDYDARFYFTTSDKDISSEPSDYEVQRYLAPTWYSTTTDIQAALSTKFTGYTLFGDFAVGEIYDAATVYNAELSFTWNGVTPTTTNWIKIHDDDGTIDVTTGSAFIVGTNTEFTEDINEGDKILLQQTPTTVVGIVKTPGGVIDDTNIELELVATVTVVNKKYGIQEGPDANDFVYLGNPYVPGDVSITLTHNEEIKRLFLADKAYSHSLSHNAGISLTSGTNVIIKHPSANSKTNSWNINGGSTNILGNLVIGSDDGASVTRVAKVVLTTGTLDIDNTLVFDLDATPAFNVTGILDLTGGGCVVNHGGSVTLNNGTGTITPGATSIFRYNRTISGQDVVFEDEVKYANLYISNTSSEGCYLTEAVTTTNVTGDLILEENSLFNNNGYAISGNGTKTFELKKDATFKMTGNSVFPSGYGTTALYTTSDGPCNVYYNQGVDVSSIDVALDTYGHLYLQPAFNGKTFEFLLGTTVVEGNLTMGDGTYTSIIIDANTNGATVDINGNLILNSNTEFQADNGIPLTIAGNWTNNGGTFTPSTGTIKFDGGNNHAINGTAATQTFYGLEVNKSGNTLSVGGSTTALIVTNFTNTLGQFAAPATITINGDIQFDGGTYTANTNTYTKGDWIDNGGTFTPGAYTVTFNNTTVDQQINGSAASETFNNISLENTGFTLSAGGSVVEINCNSLSLPATAGTFTTPATMNIQGDFTIAGGTYTCGTSTNFSKNITNNGGTFTLGTTVAFNGSTDQILGGTQAYNAFTNFTINNSGNTETELTLEKPITINGALKLTAGNIISTSTNIIDMGLTGTIDGTDSGDDDSFVKGPMQYKIDVNTDSEKKFPVGSNSRIHEFVMNIKQATATETIYTGEYKEESAQALGWTLYDDCPCPPGGSEEHTAVSNSGYWIIEKGVGANVSTCAVTLFYNSDDGITDIANLRVAKGNPSSWTNKGGTGSVVNDGFISTTINFTSFSYFSLANKVGGTNALPIELLDFDAQPNDKVVNINWSTSIEINNDYFTVERSTDGENYSEIGVISGAGNNNTTLYYSFEDQEPLNGISYYRLKQTDYDGKSSYSEIVSINYYSFEVDDMKINVYPNPIGTEKLYVHVEKYSNADNMSLSIRSVTGRIVHKEKRRIEDSETLFSINIPEHWARGLYIIEIRINDLVNYEKLIIQ